MLVDRVVGVRRGLVRVVSTETQSFEHALVLLVVSEPCLLVRFLAMSFYLSSVSGRYIKKVEQTRGACCALELLKAQRCASR